MFKAAVKITIVNEGLKKQSSKEHYNDNVLAGSSKTKADFSSIILLLTIVRRQNLFSRSTCVLNRQCRTITGKKKDLLGN